MYRKLICLIGLMAIFAWSANALAVPPALVDDFNSYNNGLVNVVTTNWKAIVGSGGEPMVTAITADSNTAYNKAMTALYNNWGGVYGILSGDAIIANNTTKTLFMRIRASATTTDLSFGMTDVDVPVSNGWGQYGPQFRFLTGNIQARDGIGWGVPLKPFVANTWYYVWAVVNHTANTFKLYVNTTGNTATESDRVGPTSEYGFRIATVGQPRDANDMDRFMTMTGGNGGTTDWKVWVDDIYVADGTDLTAMWEKWASSPNPADNSTYSGADVTLKWTQGRSVAKNDVYFDTDFADVNSATRASHPGLLHYSENQDPNNYPVTGLIPGTTYYWRIDEVNGLPDSTVYKGKVWSFKTKPLTAYNPGPPNGDILVDPNAILSWSPGFLAKTHDVNFGTTNPPPFIQNQAGITYDPYGAVRMAFNQLYYWQIKEVNDNPPGSWPGPVWSFTTWPNTPHTPDPCLVGWWKFEDSHGGKTLDSSGYNHHGTLHGDPNYTDGIFSDAIHLDGVDDWVSVGSVGISGAAPRTIAGWAKMNTTTGSDMQFTNVFGFFAGGNTTEHTCFNIDVTGNQIPGVPNNWYMIHILNWQRYILPPDLGWHHLAATYDGTTVKWYGDGVLKGEEIPSPSLTTIDNVQMGKRTTSEDTFPGLIDDVRIYNRALTLAEIRLIMSPPQAWLPYPANNELEADKSPILTWKPGCYADVRPGQGGHELYFSSDFNDVNERKFAAGPHILSDPCYTPPGEPLAYPKTYYWRVDEVNDSHPDSPWKGNIWRFTVPIYKVVDNFELYTKTGTRDLSNLVDPILPATIGPLRRTWIDGLWTVEWGQDPPFVPTFVPTVATSGSYVQLNTDPNDGNTPNWVLYNNSNTAQGGTKSMKFYYDNDGSINWVKDLLLPLPFGNYDLTCWNYTIPNYYSEASAAIDDAARLNLTSQSPGDQNSLGMLRNWSGYKVLKLSYYGDSNNILNAAKVIDKLYVGLRDGDGTEVTLYHSDSDPNIKLLGWHDWYIRLKDFNTPPTGTSAMNLTDVNRIYIGIGTRGNTTTKGGKGAVFFDDIRLYPGSVCIPGTVAGDFNGDCKVDANDLQRMTEVWLGQMPSLPTPVINLDASGLTLGATLSTSTPWPNTGSAGGSFGDFNTSLIYPQTGYRPKVQMVEGVKAVVFDSNDIMKATIKAPASITGSNPFTIIYKVWNLDIGVADRVFTWAKRSAITGKFAGVGYGSNASYGAVSHGATATAADAPFDTGFARGVPAAHTWHTIAITYPGCSPGGPNTVETVMVDGVVNATEAKNINIWPGCDMVIGGGYDGNSTAVPPVIGNPMDFLSGALSNLKVYSVAIPPKDLAILMGTTEWMGTPTPIDMKVDNVINFKDLALFAKKWMQTNLFP
jgi:hypothetical protein